MKRLDGNRTLLVSLGALVLLMLVIALVFFFTRGNDTTDTTQPAPDSATTNKIQSQSGADTANVTQQAAEKIVTDKYGGTVKETSSDDYRNTPAWEVEVRDSSQGRIEVKVNKTTGEIMNVEQDD